MLLPEKKKILKHKKCKIINRREKKPHQNLETYYPQIPRFLRTLTGNIGLQSNSSLRRDTEIHSYKGKAILNNQMHPFFCPAYSVMTEYTKETTIPAKERCF